MVQTLYLMRHGQTLFNQQGKMQGWCDSPLTELGKQQARAAAEYFTDIPLGSAYSSTSERTSDTLELITDLPYQRIKGLKEWNFGAMEGEHDYLIPPLPYDDFFVDFGGEGEEPFRKRVAATILDLMKKEKHEHVLMVSHGACCRQFISTWAHTSDLAHSGRLGNCCILKFEFSDDTFRLLEINDPNKN
ncbi:histidine phosphatase family protein [Enterococcus pallens]|uniref:Phosphoglycerate mutase n=1 Tax=Enterococcus pallens ATCC BAA-351 TaxID=1158607 RepID=R2TBI7_9ENTE|nr:histidine phosphatase family protein [Enterococcus pallens]EOH97574.1 hypothetical protein UAU_00242 [Enterococcus pallens ATCC BAA-351]EOU21007.1 hypothetical protein I588_01854 [Enterococcus pallens ATCC BAA-351]